MVEFKNPFQCKSSKDYPNVLLTNYTPKQKVQGTDLCLDRIRPNVMTESLKVYGVDDQLFLTVFIYEDRQTCSKSSMLTLWNEVSLMTVR